MAEAERVHFGCVLKSGGSVAGNVASFQRTGQSVRRRGKSGSACTQILSRISGGS